MNILLGICIFIAVGALGLFLYACFSSDGGTASKGTADSDDGDSIIDLLDE